MVKGKRENTQLRDALDVATREREQAESRANHAEKDAAEKIAQTTQDMEERVREQEAQFHKDVVSIREESDQKVSDAEGAGGAGARAETGCTPCSWYTLVFLEDLGNSEDLEKTEGMIDSLTEWQVEYIIDAEATVRRDLARIGAEYRKAMIAGKSDDDLMILRSRLDTLIDELQNIRSRAERYEQGVIDEYSMMRNITRLWEGMRERVKNGDRLTKKEVEFLYGKDVDYEDLKNILNDDLYREILLMRHSRKQGKEKEDYAVLYDCNEDQVVLHGEDEISEQKIFSGDIVYYDSSLVLKHNNPYATSPRVSVHNRVKCPLIVGGDVSASNLTFFEDGVDFPLRVEGRFSVRDVVPEHTFPKYIQYGCFIVVDEHSLTEGFVFSEYVGGNFAVHATGPVENNTFPRHVEGDFGLSGTVTSFRSNVCPEYIGGDCNLVSLTTAEGFECPDNIVGKLILNRKLKEDKNLHIPEGIRVYWV